MRRAFRFTQVESCSSPMAENAIYPLYMIFVDYFISFPKPLFIFLLRTPNIAQKVIP